MFSDSFSMLTIYTRSFSKGNLCIAQPLHAPMHDPSSLTPLPISPSSPTRTAPDLDVSVESPKEASNHALGDDVLDLSLWNPGSTQSVIPRPLARDLNPVLHKLCNVQHPELTTFLHMHVSNIAFRMWRHINEMDEIIEQTLRYYTGKGVDQGKWLILWPGLAHHFRLP